jgi:hypothetical protein
MVLPNKESISFFYPRGGRGDTPRTPRFKYYFLFFLTIQGGSMTFYEKTFTPPRHKDSKKNINQKVLRFALCLGAFVAIFSLP